MIGKKVYFFEIDEKTEKFIDLDTKEDLRKLKNFIKMKDIFFIAEIGINHNGDMKICKELILLAKKAGFHAVKFQKRDINLVYTKEMLTHLGKVHGEKLKENKKQA